MFKHVWVVAWRNICKYKISATIGVVGLAMGLLCFVLCNFCARLFFNTDKLYPNSKRIAEVQLKVGEGDNLRDYYSGTPPTLIAALEADFSGQVECFTALSYGGTMNVTFEKEPDKSVVYNIRTIEVDRYFQKVFSCQLLKGDWEQLFRQKNAVVLSRSMAQRIYGDQNPIGKVYHPNRFTFRTSGNFTPEELAAIDYMVLGVMEDLPVNSSFSFLLPVDALLINDQYGLFAQYVQGSGSSGCNTYALLRPDVTQQEVNQRVDREKHRIYIGGMYGKPVFLDTGTNYLEGYRLMSYFYLCIGLLILLVAVLNFFTLITGNFFNRLKEYNIRRGIGSNRWQLLGLIWTETMILLLVAGILVACLLELFYDRLDFSLTFRKIVFQPKELYIQLLEYLGIGVGVCFLICWGITGRLSRKQIRIAAGQSSKAGKQRGRNLMLGVQMVICFLFFTGGLAVYLQSEKNMNHIFPSLSKSERENILEINLDYPQLKGQEKDFIGRFGQIAGVADILPMDNALFGQPPRVTVNVKDQYFEFKEMKVGPNFASFLNLPLLSGQVFHEAGQVVADQNVNRLYGENLIEKGFEDIDGVKINVSGVVEAIPNIYKEGGRTSMLWEVSEQPTCCYLKVWPGARAKVIAEVRKMLDEMIPETIGNQIPTLEEVVWEQNRMQEQSKSMLLFFTVVCLLITVLGIYSAISIDTYRRRKEIAIRKINGVPGSGIIRMFIRLYLRLLLIAIGITFPVLWFLIQQWLQLFTVHFYHGVGFWIFILFVIMIIIALTIAWKIREIIQVNPVEALKEE